LRIYYKGRKKGRGKTSRQLIQFQRAWGRRRNGVNSRVTKRQLGGKRDLLIYGEVNRCGE